MILESLNLESAFCTKVSHSSAERSCALSSASIFKSVNLYSTCTISSSLIPANISAKWKNPPVPLLLIERSSAKLGYNQVLDQHLGTRFECPDQLSKDPDGILVGPIMENATEEIHLRSLNRLLGEEVMSHEFQPTFQLWRDGAVGHSIREVLYDAYEIGKPFRQRDHGRSVRAAYIHNFTGAEFSPWVVV